MKTSKNKLFKEMEWKNAMANEAKSKFYQYSEEINGTTYIFQAVGKRMLTRIIDEATGADGKRSTEKVMDLAFKHIIVSPEVTFEYFDEPEHEEDFDRVAEIIGEFLAGNFRNLGKKD